jgi:hypothetical protein
MILFIYQVLKNLREDKDFNQEMKILQRSTKIYKMLTQQQNQLHPNKQLSSILFKMIKRIILTKIKLLKDSQKEV